LAFNDVPIETSGDLPPIVGANPPGTKAKVLVSRDGKEMTFDVTLDALQPGSGEQSLAGEGSAQQSNAIGLAVEALSEDQRRALGNPQGGVIISKVESDAAYRVGLRPGDVILMINNQPVNDVNGFEKIVKGIKPGKAIALRVFRDGVSNFIAYTPSAKE
jgi:serine protease Do